MSKYSNWISFTGLALLTIACFLPWTYHADIDRVFTGFFSEKNVYGKPGRALLVLAFLSALCSFLPRVWAKRAGLLVAALNLAYAIKNFLVFGACYQGYCPEKKAGLYLMLFSTILLLVSALFPKGNLKIETPLPENPQGASPTTAE
jgi:hypothetical protein